MIAATYARTSSVVAVVALALSLAVAPSAEAQGAWLLWTLSLYKGSGAVTRTERGVERSIERAFDSQRACEQAIPEQVASHLKIWRGVYKDVKVPPGELGLIVAKGQEIDAQAVLIIRVSCWPLGVQPKSYLGGAEYPSGGREP